MATSPTTALLGAARSGDEAAFGRLVAPYRGELHAHCYRMLASVHDAEDTLQETLLRAWRALGRFEGRSSLRSWLYTIATNTSLNAIARRPKRTLPLDEAPSREASDGLGLPLSETVWIEPYPDEQLGLEEGRTGPALRAARERRAGVHRRAPAPARQPARGADPAGGAGVLGPRGRRRPRDDGAVRQQRAPARPQDGRGEAARPEPAGDAARARRPAPQGGRGRLHGRDVARRRREDRRDAGRGRGVVDAAAAGVVHRPRRHPGVPGARAALRPLALEAPPDPRGRSGGDRELRV